MTPARAFLTETRRSFDLRGRSARVNYLWFLLFSTTLFAGAILACIAVLPAGHVSAGVYQITAIFYLPVTAAGIRRLHDVGESGTLMLMPHLPTLVAGLILLALGLAYDGSASVKFVTILAAMFFAEIVYAIMAVVFISATVMTLMYFSNTMGLLLLPSTPGPNKYGPNPNEVPQ